MTPTDRQLALVLELQAGPWLRAADLAATFDVSTRTIYRDMEVLVAAGVPVVAVPGKGYRLNEGYFLPPLTLTTDEAVLVLLGTEHAADRLGTSYRAAALSVQTKVERILPDRLRGEVATLRNSLRFVPVNAFEDPAERAVLHGLRDALAGQQAVRFTYAERAAGDGVATVRTVHPYGLVHVGEAWHLVGWCRQQERVQHFQLRRVAGLEVLHETFERPQGYAASRTDLADHRELHVRVAFDADVARWVREAPSSYVAAMDETPDGGLLVTLTVEREAEVLPWLLSWGAHAHVLEPASLQHRLAREAERIAARYRSSPTLLG